jgi:tetratricopeptide (TPR) repeat protein
MIKSFFKSASVFAFCAIVTNTPLLAQKAEELIRKAKAFTQEGETYKAFALLNQAVQMEPNNYKCYQERSVYYMVVVNDKEKALADINKAVALNKSNPVESLKMRADILLRLDKKALALLDFDKIVYLNPRDTMAYVFRANIKSSFKKDYAGAIADIEKALSLDSLNIMAVSGLSSIYLDMEKYDLATTQLKRLVKLEPDSEFHYNNLAYAEMKNGDLQNALTHVDKSLNINPYYNAALDTRADIRLRLGDFENGCKDFMRYLLSLEGGLSEGCQACRQKCK